MKLFEPIFIHGIELFNRKPHLPIIHRHAGGIDSGIFPVAQ